MTKASRSTITPIGDEQVDVLTSIKKGDSGTRFKALISTSASFVAKKTTIYGRKEKSSDAQYLLEKIALAEERFQETQRQHHEERTIWRADRLKLERLRKKLKNQDQSQPQRVPSKNRDLQAAGNETGEKSSNLSQSSKHEDDDNVSVEEQVHNRQVMRLARQQELVSWHAEEVLELRQSLHDLQTEHNITLAQMKQQSEALSADTDSGGNSYTKNLQAQLDNWQSLYYESCEQGNRKIRALEVQIETLSKQQQEQQEQAHKDKKESGNYFSKVKLEVTQLELKKTRLEKEKVEKALAEAKAQLESKTQKWEAQQVAAESELQEKAEKEVKKQKEIQAQAERERTKLIEEQKKLELRLQEMPEENRRIKENGEERENELGERIKLQYGSSEEEIHPDGHSNDSTKVQDGATNELDGPSQPEVENLRAQLQEDLLQQMEEDNTKLDTLQQDRKEIEQQLEASDQKSFYLAIELEQATSRMQESNEPHDLTQETAKEERQPLPPVHVTADNDEPSTVKGNDMKPNVQDLLQQIDASHKHTKELESQLEAMQEKFEALSQGHVALQQSARAREKEQENQLEEEKNITHEVRVSLESEQVESEKVSQEKEKLERQLRDLTQSLEQELNRMKNELSLFQIDCDRLQEETATWEATANDRDKACQETQKNLFKQKEESFRLQREVDDTKRVMAIRIEEVERRHADQQLLSQSSKQHMKDLEWQVSVLKGGQERSMSYRRLDQSKEKEEELTKWLTEEQAKTKALHTAAEAARMEANATIAEKKEVEGKLEEMTAEMKRESSRLTGELKAAEELLSTLLAVQDSLKDNASAESQEREKGGELLRDKERELEKASHQLEDSNALVTKHLSDMEQTNAAKEREIKQLQDELDTRNQQVYDMKLQHDREQDAILERVEKADQDVDEILKAVERRQQGNGAKIEDLKQNLAQERENVTLVGNEADELRRQLESMRHKLYEAQNLLKLMAVQQATIEELQSDLAKAKSAPAAALERHDEEPNEQRSIARSVLDELQQPEDTMMLHELVEENGMEREMLENELIETKTEMSANTEAYRSELASQKAKTEAALEVASKAKNDHAEVKQHLDESLAKYSNLQNASETSIAEAKEAAEASQEELLTLRKLLDEKDQRVASLEKELQEAKESQNISNTTLPEDETACVMASALFEMQNGGDFITAAEKYEEVAGGDGDAAQEAGIEFLLSAISSSQDEIEALRLQIEAGGMFETALRNLITQEVS